MQETAPEIFKVDDEDGMVALYRRVEQSSLAVSVGEIIIAAKFLGYAKAEQASHIMSFKEMVAAATAAAAGEAA